MTSSKKQKPALAHIENDHIGLERLVFFSDAVFAIAVTLLALEIRLPSEKSALTDAELLQYLLALWPKYLGYILSFLIVGSFWLGHHRRFRYIQRYDATLIFLNLLLLMIIAFIPFPTAVLSEHGNQVATIFYALTIAATGLLSTSIWVYASHKHRLIDPHLPAPVIQRDTLRQLAVSAVFLLSVGLSFVNYDLAKMAWILVAPVVLFIR
ncbi:MAG: TMEM175 family protein [Anaerolineae bacterium]